MASWSSSAPSRSRSCRTRMAPSTEKAAARVSGSESANWACWSASWSRPCSTSTAALWRAPCAWAPKVATGGRTLHKSTARENAATPRPSPPSIRVRRRRRSRVPTAARPPLVSVVEPQTKLDRSCLVALCADGAERGGAEVRVRGAEGRPVEDVAELGHEPHLHVAPQREGLGDGHVFVVHRESAHRPVGSRRVAEREGTRVLPRGLVEVVVGVRVEIPADGHSIGPGAVRTLLGAEEQAAHVVGHGDEQRSAALVPQDSADVPAAQEGLLRSRPALRTA